MTRKKVVVTGAAGLIAGQMLPALRTRYDLTLLDVRTTDCRLRLSTPSAASSSSRYSQSATRKPSNASPSSATARSARIA